MAKDSPFNPRGITRHQAYVFTQTEIDAVNLSLRTRSPMLIVGPRGNGKRSLTEAVSKVLGIPLHRHSLDRQTTAAEIRAIIPAAEGTLVPPGVYVLLDVEWAQTDVQNTILDCWSDGAGTRGREASGGPRLLMLTSTLTAQVPEDLLRSTITLFLGPKSKDELLTIAKLHHPQVKRKTLMAVVDNYMRGLEQNGRVPIVSEMLTVVGECLQVGWSPNDELLRSHLLRDAPSRFEPQAEPEIFVSYSRSDSEFATELATELKRRGHRVWVDHQELTAGVEWQQEIDAALVHSSTVLVILSPDAVRSDQVRAEWTLAMNHHKRIIPIVARACDVPIRLAIMQFIDATRLSASDPSLIEQIHRALGRQ
jgi:hypothetical protein